VQDLIKNTLGGLLNIPKSHPRFVSLSIREKIVKGYDDANKTIQILNNKVPLLEEINE